jgi:nucleoid DNA-binding protein
VGFSCVLYPRLAPALRLIVQGQLKTFWRIAYAFSGMTIGGILLPLFVSWYIACYMSILNKQDRLLGTMIAVLKTQGKARYDVGTFEVKYRKPQTVTLTKGEVGTTKQTKPFVYVSFKASKTLKDLLNNG